jgi:hypothetical protein
LAKRHKPNRNTKQNGPGKHGARCPLFSIPTPHSRGKDCFHGRIISYDDPSLTPETPGQTITSWNIAKANKVVVLYAGGYYCPSCHLKNLRFTLVGMHGSCGVWLL